MPQDVPASGHACMLLTYLPPHVMGCTCLWPCLHAAHLPAPPRPHYRLCLPLAVPVCCSRVRQCTRVPVAGLWWMLRGGWCVGGEGPGLLGGQWGVDRWLGMLYYLFCSLFFFFFITCNLHVICTHVRTHLYFLDLLIYLFKFLLIVYS